MEEHKGFIYKVGYIEESLSHDELKHLHLNYVLKDTVHLPSPTAPCEWPVVLFSLPDGSLSHIRYYAC